MSFQIFLKICGDIRKRRFTTGINDTGGKFATSANDTGGKFANSVNYTGGKLPPVSTTLAANFANGTAGVVDTGRKLPPVSRILAANLPPVANNGNNIKSQKSCVRLPLK